MGFGATLRGRRMKSKRVSQAAGKAAEACSEMLLRLHLESNPEALSLVRATLERATEVLHFHEAESRAIVRSVDEALANILCHAYQGQNGHPIEVTCRRLHDANHAKGVEGLEIVLQDSGKAIDPRELKGRPLDEIRPGGLGLHFMRQSMDEVEFSRKNGKNQLRLVKYVAPEASGKKAEGE